MLMEVADDLMVETTALEVVAPVSMDGEQKWCSLWYRRHYAGLQEVRICTDARAVVNAINTQETRVKADREAGNLTIQRLQGEIALLKQQLVEARV